jgi:hypothetical protein
MMESRRLVIVGILAASIYGTTYQQFRHFNLSDPRGANDSASYIRMSHGDYQVTAVHRYRFMVPVLAGALRPLVQRFVHDPGEQDRVSFYVVNFGCTLAASWLLLLLLDHLGFSIQSSLLGTFMFVTSRITILVTGTPLVDAPYLAAGVMIVYLTFTRRVWCLILILPLLVLVKEQVLLVAFVPLLVPAFRRISYAVSLITSVTLLHLSRSYIDRIAGIGLGGWQPAQSLFELVMNHIKFAGDNALHLFTSFSGLHSLQNGYSLFLLFAGLGFFTNRRTKFMPDSPVLFSLVPISLLFAVLSGNGGRMIFLAFPIVIPYALIFIQDVLKFPTG